MAHRWNLVHEPEAIGVKEELNLRESAIVHPSPDTCDEIRSVLHSLGVVTKSDEDGTVESRMNKNH